jgi:hypothetical protein
MPPVSGDPLARAYDLHGVPASAGERRDAASIELGGRSSGAEIRNRIEDRTQLLSAHGRRLGLRGRDALVVPKLHSRALAAARASLVRFEIRSRSASPKTAIIWTVILLAYGLSTETKSTLSFISLVMK